MTHKWTQILNGYLTRRYFSDQLVFKLCRTSLVIRKIEIKQTHDTTNKSQNIMGEMFDNMLEILKC